MDIVSKPEAKPAMSIHGCRSSATTANENWKEFCFDGLATELGWKEGCSDAVEGKENDKPW